MYKLESTCHVKIEWHQLACKSLRGSVLKSSQANKVEKIISWQTATLPEALRTSTPEMCTIQHQGTSHTSVNLHNCAGGPGLYSPTHPSPYPPYWQH